MMSAIDTPLGSLKDSKLGQGCSAKMSMASTDVDHGIGCSDLPEFCSDAKDSFSETIMNPNALNGEGDLVNNSSAISASPGKHGLFKNDVSGGKEMSTDEIIHNIDELSADNLPDSKGFSKHVDTLNSPVIILSSPDEKTDSHFVKENSVNGGLKNACVKVAKEMSMDEIIHDIDELSAVSKMGKKGDQNLDTEMEVDDSPAEPTTEIKKNTEVQKVNVSSDELKNSLDNSGQSVSMDTSHECTDAICENTVSCSKDSNMYMNSMDHNSVDNSSTNHEQSKSLSVTGLEANHVSSVLDKNKTKHSCDNIPFNPLTIHDKVRNSMRDIMYKLKHSKTTELTKTCSKNKSEDACTVISGKDCDTEFRADSKLLCRKDNLFESISEFSVKPKLDEKKPNSLTSVDTDDKEQTTNTEQDAKESEIGQNSELHLELDNSESESKTDSSDSVEKDITDETNKTESGPEQKDEGSAVTTDTSNDSESQPNSTKHEGIFNDQNSFPNSVQSNSCLIDECEVDNAIALCDETDADGSPLSSASVSNTEQMPSSNDESQSASSESQNNVEKMETSDISTDNDVNDLKSPDLISDELKENNKNCDSNEVEKSSKQEDMSTLKEETAEEIKETTSVDAAVHKEVISVDTEENKEVTSVDAVEDEEMTSVDAEADKEVTPVDAEVHKEVTSVDAKADKEVTSVDTKEDKEVSSVDAVEDEEMTSVGADATNERKRFQEDALDSDQPLKRSRLDEVIGKLGSVIGISPETVEQVDSDSDSEESRHSESSGVKSEAEDVTSVSDEEDDKTSQATSQSSTKTVRLSSKELEVLVRSKVQTYMSAHRDEEIVQLQKRVADLQEANDKWKTQARELQKQVVDLTVLKQKLEKRKAATAALRQITTKAIGIQVSLDEPKTMSVVAQRLAKTPPKSTAAVALTSVLTQPPQATQNTLSLISAVKPNTPTVTLTSSAIAARNSVTQLLTATAMPRVSTAITSVSTPPVPSAAGVRPQLTQHLNNTQLNQHMNNAASTVRSLLDSARIGDTVRLQGVPNSMGSSLLVVSPITPNTTQTPVNAIPKVIDLTADDDGQLKPGQMVQTVQVLPPGATASQLRPANLHQLPQQVIRQMGPQQPRQPGQPLAQAISGASILLSSPAGTQILNNAANLNRAGGTFQVVTIASGPNIRPGTLLTMVPATSTQLSSVRPQGVSVAKQISPQAMPQLRAGQPTQLTYTTTSVRPSAPVQSMRPPPPLMSAPPPQTQTIVRVNVPPTSNSVPSSAVTQPVRHPAPLPSTPSSKSVSGKPLPPKPSLKISRVSQGIVLSWNVTSTENVSDISSYQLFAYQETSSPASSALWKKVGDVKALPLPMACTLTQFQDGNKYHFAVRAVDQTGRFGDFSEPSTIHLASKP
ncbi:dentin sialophosphoprotein-like isoform X2 [Gigantopelta aegis]|uniref:dentin sialophosphoprotein-like isoform X2 n=1 Tax=Gigantopelta aegis TaxID=1735272 RepID=UPI001B88E0CD|nr:dentin sialophosphoprotein-like isoform X2 [Gigantopelta aegis]